MMQLQFYLSFTFRTRNALGEKIVNPSKMHSVDLNKRMSFSSRKDTSRCSVEETRVEEVQQ